MSIRGRCVALVLAGAALAAPATATADVTIGNVVQPSGSSVGACAGPAAAGVVFQQTSEAGTTYTVPSGGFTVKQWQLNVGGADEPTLVALVVLRPSGGNYVVVGSDPQAVPAPTTPPYPAGTILTFTPPSPITVLAGDMIGVWMPRGATAPCLFSGPAVSASDTVNAAPTASEPTAGQSLSPVGASPSGYRVNVAATLAPATAAPAVFDAAVSMTAAPSSAMEGQPALFEATVSNNGPDSAPITFTDHVPTGLTVDFAGTSAGSCATTVGGNVVTCTIPNLGAGDSAKVGIAVTPTAPQTYANTASVSGPDGFTDTNAANNSASASLTVSAPAAAPKCVVPKLKGVSLRLAKSVLGSLGCKAGKSTKAHSKAVPKGQVISTSPGPGTYAANTVIALKVSSGPPPRKHKPKKR